MSNLDHPFSRRTGGQSGVSDADALRAEIAAHKATRRELEKVRREAQVRLFDRTQERDAAKARFETALHGAKIHVFSQDRNLRYTFASKPLFGLSVEEMLGNTDEHVIPPPNRAVVIAAKREVLASGQPRDAEYRIETASGARWYDFHIEPLRDIEGAVIGLTGAAVDVTERKESEAHLRLLMRELTHRSKNLLAVIQAMARQTARHAGNIERFLERFGNRLQALARSHDLLVQEGWHGASLTDLVRSQLGHYLDRKNSQVSIQGEDVQLKPDAAQSLGLALHELATNAAKYGALSRVRGRVDIAWKRLSPAEGGAIELQWTESKGPKVSGPKRRGFGSMVIEYNLARALEADVTLAFEPDGLKCRMIVPGSHVLEERDAQER